MTRGKALQKSSVKPFVTNSRYVLLTYSQSGDLTAEAVGGHIQGLAGEYIIGRELHGDGGNHLHAFVDFKRKFRSRRVDIFDVGGVHPNVKQSYGTPEKGWDYAIKDGEIYGGLPRPERPTRGDCDGESDSAWHSIASATSREQVWELVFLHDPKAGVIYNQQISKFCDWKFAPVITDDELPTGWRDSGVASEVRDMWLSQSRIGTDGVGMGGRVKSLVLFGVESKTGKTTWARSLGKHIFCVGLVSGSECMKAQNVDYAIFDDIRGGFKFFPSFKEWLGCQMRVSVKVLHKEPVQLKWNKPSIWLANRDPRLEMHQDDVYWMEANCIFLEINDKFVFFD